jgi:PAS domain S-box-containing protein
MNLREKTLMVMGTSIVLLIVILYVIAQMELFLSFSKLEEGVVRKDVERAQNAISNEFDGMKGLADYWADRNDTFSFLYYNDSPFIKDNLASGDLADESMRTMGIDMLLFMDPYGQVAFGKYFDQYGNSTKIPSDLSTQLSFYGFCPGCLDKNSKYSGIILLSDHPMLIVTNPVIKSEGGVSAGRIVIGRYLNDKEVSKISEITQLNISLNSLNGDNMPADFKEAKLHLPGNDPIFVGLLSRESIAGYALLNNIYDNPMLILRVDSPRAIYTQGMKSLMNFVILFSAAGIILFVLTLIYLDRSVLSRLSDLTTGVAVIGKSQNMTSRLAVKGKDELSGLALSINGMLEALEKAHSDLVKSERRYKAVVEEQSDLILRNLIDGTITFANEVFCKFFSCNLDKIAGQKIDALIPTDNLKSAIDLIGQLKADNPTTTFESLFSGTQGRQWIHWTSHGIFDESGSMIEVQSVGRDITQLKLADEALKQSERRLADIIDFMPDALLAIDMDGKVIVWNKAMESLTKVKADRMLGKGNYEHALPFYGLRRPILADMVLEPFKDFEPEYISFQKDGDAVLGETFIPGLGPSGSYLLAKAATLYDAEGNKAGAIESIQDMTERRNMEQRLERTRTELHIAADIQKSFIPEETPVISEFEIDAVTIPAMEVGGDFYDFILQPDGRYGLVIADVAGKSIPAALFMALSRTIIRANATNQSNVSNIIKNANKMIASDASAGMFVTLLYGVLDGPSLSFNYANAGHPPPIVFRSTCCIFEEETPIGIALGIIDDAEYKEGCIRFSSGDMAIFYTDGVTEAMNARGEMYGVKRLMDVVRRNRQAKTKDIIKEILADIAMFSQQREQHDDITLVAVRAIGPLQNHLEFRLLAKEESIPKVISCIEKRMSHAGFSIEEIMDLQVAVEECYVNIINHGYRKGEGFIWITFDSRENSFTVTLEDGAPRFDPTLYHKPNRVENVEDQPIGGWGINLIRSLTDEIKYDYENNKNKLTLIKRKKITYEGTHIMGES